MKKIILTGGGTAGHVTPNIALIDRLKKEGYEIYYIGSYDGIEKTLIEGLGIPYYGISSGKFRRYLSVKNLTDPFRINKGCRQAKKLFREIKPDVCFSKGGFVSVPVVYAAHKCKVPVIIHESDMTPGLANKLSIPRAAKVCCNFPETLKYLPKDKGVHTGTPIRKELFTGSRQAAIEYCGFNKDQSGAKTDSGKLKSDDSEASINQFNSAAKVSVQTSSEQMTGRANYPILLVVGGSTGAKSVNEAVWSALPELLEKYNVIHLCGKGKSNPDMNGKTGYCQIEYCDKEMKDMLAAADIVISRAGANAICELLALKKPNILIPLSAQASRGDQILNANSFEKQGFSKVMQDEEVTKETLLAAVDEVYKNREKYVEVMKQAKTGDSEEVIMGLIKEVQK